MSCYFNGIMWAGTAYVICKIDKIEKSPIVEVTGEFWQISHITIFHV